MRFLVHNQPSQSYGGYYRRRRKRYVRKIITRLSIVLAIAYCLSCLFLYFRQGSILYRPSHKIAVSYPSDRDFQLDYQDVWINVPNSKHRIHGWWFDAPAKDKPIIAVANEPVNILTSPKTMLYFCGRGGSKTHYNNLARIKGFQQLGFSVLAIDYRGYGLSEGHLPNESRLYEDSQATWQYLTTKPNIAPEKIVIYGESMGGAIAIDLAVQQPDVAGLIVQSSFTSMVEQIKQMNPRLKIFPLKSILHQHFDSISKVRLLSVPVLYLHGTADSIVNYKMSRKLYYATPEPKQLFFVPEGEHLNLYKPGKDSYLKAMEDFLLNLE